MCTPLYFTGLSMPTAPPPNVWRRTPTVHWLCHVSAKNDLSVDLSRSIFSMTMCMTPGPYDDNPPSPPSTNDGDHPPLPPQWPRVPTTHGWRWAPTQAAGSPLSPQRKGTLDVRRAGGRQWGYRYHHKRATSTHHQHQQCAGKSSYPLPPIPPITLTTQVPRRIATWQPDDEQRLTGFSLSSEWHNTRTGRRWHGMTSPDNDGATTTQKRDDDDNDGSRSSSHLVDSGAMKTPLAQIPNLSVPNPVPPSPPYHFHTRNQPNSHRLDPGAMDHWGGH